MSWIINYGGTVVVGMVVLGIVYAAFCNVRQAVKSGRCVGCSGCDGRCNRACSCNIRQTQETMR